MPMPKKLIVFICAIVAALLTASWIYRDLYLDWISWDALGTTYVHLEELSNERPLMVMMVFFVVYVLVNTFSIPVATILALLAGALYGRLWGTVMLSLASTLGGCFTFLLARYLLKPWVEKVFSKQLHRLESKWGGRGFVLLASLRIQPIFPYVLINLLFGLSRMKLLDFAWVSFFALMPNTFVVVIAGERLSTIRGPQDIYRWDILMTLLLMAIVPKLLSKCFSLMKQTDESVMNDDDENEMFPGRGKS